MSPRLLGDVVARGSRSLVHAYGRGAVAKVPKPATPASWILFEAEFVEAVRAVGAPAPSLLGIEQVSGRPASIWERVDGPSLWQQVVDRPDRSVDIGRTLADVQLALFEFVPPVTLPDQRDRLISKIRWSAANVDSSLALALDLMPARTGTPRLCHGDLHPSNVIISQSGPVIVDWFDASRGDQVADVGPVVADVAGPRSDHSEPSARSTPHARRAHPGVPVAPPRNRSHRCRRALRLAGGWLTRWLVWPRGCRASPCSRSGGGSSGRSSRRWSLRPPRAELPRADPRTRQARPRSPDRRSRGRATRCKPLPPRR